MSTVATDQIVVNKSVSPSLSRQTAWRRRRQRPKPDVLFSLVTLGAELRQFQQQFASDRQRAILARARMALDEIHSALFHAGVVEAGAQDDL
jgi:hypothetical protein